VTNGFSETKNLDQAQVIALGQSLIDWFCHTSTRYVIALSGGVDSAVVAKAAALARQLSLTRADEDSSTNRIEIVLATGESPSLARQELQDAAQVARLIGIEHTVIATQETSRADYQRNDARRCYYCKSQLFETLAQCYPGSLIITGTNADDLGDYRPGLQAAAEHRVRAPLGELGVGKASVRRLAEMWDLPIAEKPASPCLASRIAYGLEVTPVRLEMIERAESYLRSQGLREFRVRLHPGELARIEVPIEELPRFAADPIRQDLVAQFRTLGFRYVSLDLAGFISGSLNQLIQIAVKP
jgi:pyridinium-3,5-biscarboxylic acid mononucleotide sulfurtransferase